MHKTALSLSVILGLTLSACSPEKPGNSAAKSSDVSESPGMSVSVMNPSSGSAIPQLITLSEKNSGSQLTPGIYATSFPSEWVKNAQGEEVLNVLVTLPPGKRMSIELSKDAEKGPDVAYAELSVRQGGTWEGKQYKADGFEFKNVESFTAPPQLTDHSYFLRYEGPGWENDLIGYRLYLDWRNGTDIFVKTGNKPVLSEVGQDGYDNYHELTDWGADALKVGKALGVGSLGRLDGETVKRKEDVEQMSWALGQDNALSASFTVNYSGWEVAGKKVDAQTDYSIHAGDPSTRVSVTLSESVDDLVSGIVKHPNTEYIEMEKDGWGMIATYGRQSLLGENDELGMALFYKLEDVSRTFEGEYDYLVQFKPTANVEYGFFAVWPKHPDSPKDKAGFKSMMADKLSALAHPVEIK